MLLLVFESIKSGIVSQLGRWVAEDRVDLELPDLQTATLSWLKQYRKGRFEVYVDTSGLGKEVSKLNRIGRLVVIGIVLAGMLVGSAIAANFLAQVQEEGDFWFVIGRLAYLGYFFAMGLAVIIVLRLVWQWWRGKDDI